MMQVIAGRDRRDATSADIPVPDYRASLKKDVKGLKIGIPKEYFIEGMDKEVEASIRDAIEKFEELGATCMDISLPHTDYAVAVYYVVATAEASSNLARYDGARYGYRSKNPETIWQMYGETKDEGFGQEVKRRIMLGTYVLSSGYYDAYYLKAQKVRTLVKQDFIEAFKKVDVILTPTSPTPAFKMGEKTEDPLQMYLSDIFTISVNLSGIPAISIPCGFTKSGLPIGLQILGPFFAEDRVIQAAYAFEQNTDYHLRKPKL
jgi:aspartyl-tRNA(Asn)/glutamyl-tRNA(Gln) amidotransferase subunit A